MRVSVIGKGLGKKIRLFPKQHTQKSPSSLIKPSMYFTVNGCWVQQIAAAPVGAVSQCRAAGKGWGCFLVSVEVFSSVPALNDNSGSGTGWAGQTRPIYRFSHSPASAREDQ